MSFLYRKECVLQTRNPSLSGTVITLFVVVLLFSVILGLYLHFHPDFKIPAPLFGLLGLLACCIILGHVYCYGYARVIAEVSDEDVQFTTMFGIKNYKYPLSTIEAAEIVEEMGVGSDKGRGIRLDFEMIGKAEHRFDDPEGLVEAIERARARSLRSRTDTPALSPASPDSHLTDVPVSPPSRDFELQRVPERIIVVPEINRITYQLPRQLFSIGDIAFYLPPLLPVGFFVFFAVKTEGELRLFLLIPVLLFLFLAFRSCKQLLRDKLAREEISITDNELRLETVGIRSPTRFTIPLKDAEIIMKRNVLLIKSGENVYHCGANIRREETHWLKESLSSEILKRR